MSERRTAIQDSINNENQEIKSSWLTVPYVSSFIDKFKQFNNKDVKVSFFSLNKLINKFMKIQKDPRSSSTKNNIVYKIECKDCVLCRSDE